MPLLADLIIEDSPGFACSKSKLTEDGLIHLRPFNIGADGKLDSTQIYRVPATEAPAAKRALQAGDILFNNTNSVELVGKVAIVEQDTVAGFSNHLTRLRVDRSKIEPTYLLYFLRWLWQSGLFAAKATRWVSQAAFKSDQLRAITLPLPLLPEQRRIVDILSRAEGIIRLQRQAAQKAREIIPALFLDMFGDPMTGDSRWPLVRFDSVTRRITYGFTCPMSHLNCGIPIVTAKNVLDGWINFENVHFADKVEFNALTAKSRPTRGDILVTKDGTIGRCAVVEVDFQFCINQSVALIQPNADKVVPTYLASYLLYPSVAHRLQSMGKGQALKHLQITEVAKLSIPLPPLRLQQVFADRVNDIRGIIAQRDVLHRSGDSLFQALLARAFSG